MLTRATGIVILLLVMTKTTKTPKWERDPDNHGERYGSWSLMPAGTSQSDEEYVEPLAYIGPLWQGSSRMSGAPSSWKAVVGGKVIGTSFHGVKAAKAAVAAAMAVPS